MKLTPEQREQIYREEKERREGSGEPASVLFFLTIGAIIALTAILAVSESASKPKVRLEDLRKAYSGLEPEEEQPQ